MLRWGSSLRWIVAEIPRDGWVEGLEGEWTGSSNLVRWEFGGGQDTYIHTDMRGGCILEGGCKLK